MDAGSAEVADAFQNHALGLQTTHPLKAGGYDFQAEMAAFLRTGVPGMLRAVVDKRNRNRLEASKTVPDQLQRRFAVHRL